MKSWTLAGLLVAAPVAALGAAPAAAQNWNATYEATQQGHRLGNPEADIRLIEFISYTCPHCASFERESEAELRYFYVHEGHASIEVRHIIRNIVDVAAALTTECGPAENFYGNHRAMLSTQDEWLGRARALSPAQLARWDAGDFGSRMRAIASDLDWYELMEPRGYSATQLDACLSDQSRADAIVATANANAREYGVQGTPSFAVNETLLAEVHGWPQLRLALTGMRQGAAEPIVD